MRSLADVREDQRAIRALIPTITDLTDSRYLRSELRALEQEERSLTNN